VRLPGGRDKLERCHRLVERKAAKGRSNQYAMARIGLRFSRAKLERYAVTPIEPKASRLIATCTRSSASTQRRKRRPGTVLHDFRKAIGGRTTLRPATVVVASAHRPVAVASRPGTEAKCRAPALPRTWASTPRDDDLRTGSRLLSGATDSAGRNPRHDTIIGPGWVQ